jgi:hypothetical protein
MRRPQRNNKPLFLGVGREGERPDALPRAANVRRMNGIVPPRRSHRRRRQQMIGTRGRGDHNNQPIFGGWRRDAVATIAVATIARAMIARRAQRRAPGRAAESSEREEDKRIFPHRSHEATAVNERCERRTQQSAYFQRLEMQGCDDRDDATIVTMRRSRRHDDRNDATVARTTSATSDGRERDVRERDGRKGDGRDRRRSRRSRRSRSRRSRGRHKKRAARKQAA